MKRSIVLLPGLAFLFLTCALPAGAGAQGLGFGFAAGYAKPSNSLYSGSVAGGVVFSIGVMKYLAFEIQAGYLGPAVEASEDGLSEGRLTVVPVQLSVQGRFPFAGGRVAPFVELGGGYYLNSFALDSNLAKRWKDVGFTLEEKPGGAVGVHFGGGLDVFLGRRISLGLGLKYSLVTMKAVWSLLDDASRTEVTGELDGLTLSPLVVGLRVRFFFN
ncbi:MAG: hypothetical protein FJY83_01285 [Candidatus Aminicenantes bacterium]|nr:hypothetical protein [Candidatus Aminicenantes bacterium]